MSQLILSEYTAIKGGNYGYRSYTKLWGGSDTSAVTATAADVLEGKVIVDKDGNPLTGTMSGMDGVTITPSGTQQVVSCAGKYMNGDIVVNGMTGVYQFKLWGYAQRTGTKNFQYYDAVGLKTLNLSYVELKGFGFKPFAIYAFTQGLNSGMAATIYSAAWGHHNWRLHGGAAQWDDMNILANSLAPIETDHVLIPMPTYAPGYSINLYGYL